VTHDVAARGILLTMLASRGSAALVGEYANQGYPLSSPVLALCVSAPLREIS
jgi:hypothetical protein